MMGILYWKINVGRYQIISVQIPLDGKSYKHKVRQHYFMEIRMSTLHIQASWKVNKFSTDECAKDNLSFQNCTDNLGLRTKLKPLYS